MLVYGTRLAAAAKREGTERVIKWVEEDMIRNTYEVAPRPTRASDLFLPAAAMVHTQQDTEGRAGL